MEEGPRSTRALCLVEQLEDGPHGLMASPHGTIGWSLSPNLIIEVHIRAERRLETMIGLRSAFLGPVSCRLCCI